MAHTIEGYSSGDSSTKSQKYHNVNWIEESTTVNLIGIITPFTKNISDVHGRLLVHNACSCV